MPALVLQIGIGRTSLKTVRAPLMPVRQIAADLPLLFGPRSQGLHHLPHRGRSFKAVDPRPSVET